MNDLISRKAAIDAILTELTKQERNNLLLTWTTVEVKYFVADMLEKMPSAQPVARDINVPTNNCINRQEAIDLLHQSYNLFDAERRLEDMPSAQPERNKGQWVRIMQGAVPEKYMCPFCHRTIENDGVESLLSMRFPFCHCGADMRGEQE